MILHCISEHLLLRCSWTIAKVKEAGLPINGRILMISDVVEKLGLNSLWFPAFCYASHPDYFPLVINYVKYLHFLQEPSSQKIKFLFSEEMTKCPTKTARDEGLYTYTTKKMRSKCKDVLRQKHTKNTEVSRKELQAYLKKERNDARTELQITLNKCYRRFRTVLEDHWERCKGYAASSGNNCYYQYFVSSDCTLRLEEIEYLSQDTSLLRDTPEVSRAVTVDSSNAVKTSEQAPTPTTQDSIPPYQIPAQEITSRVEKYVDDLISNGEKGKGRVRLSDIIKMLSPDDGATSRNSSGEGSIGLQSTQSGTQPTKSNRSAGNPLRPDEQSLLSIIRDAVKKCAREVIRETQRPECNSAVKRVAPSAPLCPDPVSGMGQCAITTAQNIALLDEFLDSPPVTNPLSTPAPTSTRDKVQRDDKGDKEQNSVQSVTTADNLALLDCFLTTQSSCEVEVASEENNPRSAEKVVSACSMKQKSRSMNVEQHVSDAVETKETTGSSKRRRVRTEGTESRIASHPDKSCRKSVRLVNASEDKPDNSVAVSPPQHEIVRVVNKKRHARTTGRRPEPPGEPSGTESALLSVGTGLSVSGEGCRPSASSDIERTADHMLNLNQDTGGKKRRGRSGKISTRTSDKPAVITISSPENQSPVRTTPAPSSSKTSSKRDTSTRNATPHYETRSREKPSHAFSKSASNSKTPQREREEVCSDADSTLSLLSTD